MNASSTAAAGPDEGKVAADVRADAQSQEAQLPADIRPSGLAVPTPQAVPVAEGDEQGLMQLPAGATNPGAAAPSLASNRAFQQELQRRTGERQARAGALMSDAAAREVAGGEAAPAQTNLRYSISCT